MTRPASTVDTGPRPAARVALFEYGFRPFFLLAGWYALAVVPLWIYFLLNPGMTFGELPLMYWHFHEMLYGFVAAAIAGFLLTAVPSWTGERGFAGAPLVLLVGFWLAGRLAMATVGSVPFWLTVIAELAFLAALAALIAPPLIRSRNRNTPLLAVVGALWLLDAAFLVALKDGDVALAGRTSTLAINVVLLLTTVISGRIIPAFTSSGLRRDGVTPNVVSRRWVEVAVIGLMISIVVIDALAPLGIASGLLAAAAALVHAIRLSGWQGLRTRREPILWVLHLAYAWFPIGLALKALWILGEVSWAIKWQHALTMGVFATMILAVMTRASLGHTGRPLVVSRAIAVAYLLLTAAVVVCVFGVALAPAYYLAGLRIATVAWVLAFALYVIVYTPILVRARADGRPG